MYTIDTHTPAYARVKAAGFTIHSNVLVDDFKGEPWVRITFECVCGRLEQLGMREEDIRFYPGIVRYSLMDAALLLESVGALSIYHLVGDGFTDEEICRIRLPYESAEDTQNKLNFIRKQAA